MSASSAGEPADTSSHREDPGAPDTASTLARRHVLLVEDDMEIAKLIRLHLVDGGADVVHTADGAGGLALAMSGSWDLVLLDLGLPGCDGLDVCRQVRAFRPAMPIIVVTARTTEEERVRGLEAGADDYVVKPFGVRELLARIDALLRRMSLLDPDPGGDAGRIVVGDIELDPSAHLAIVAGRTVALTAREFALLLHFVRHPGRVFRRTELLDAVWGYSHAGYLHTVNTHINRLRGKIEPDTARPCYIETVWGVGYRLAAPHRPSSART